MNKKLGIPYMGTKRKLASGILDVILYQNPNCKYFYDLFGGGGSVSFEALDRGLTVFYNEIDKGIVALLEKIRDDGVTEEFYQWIDRETFHKYKGGTDWFAGLVKTCWSFGNQGEAYMYGKSIENKKRLIHNIVVHKCEDSLKEFNDVFGLNLSISGMVGETVHERRLWMQRYIKKQVQDKSVSKGFCKIKGGIIGRISEHLERLQLLENLRNIQDLHISSFSYESVPIDTPQSETVLYCDPPYEGLKPYQNGIDHDEFYNWVKASSYSVYVSSYDSPLQEVHSWRHRSVLSATNNSKVVTERLYCNRGKTLPIQGCLVRG